MQQPQELGNRSGSDAVAAVVFDLDGVLIDSETIWEEERRRYVAEYGGHWQPDSQRRLMGMSTTEWATYLSSDLGVAMAPHAVAAEVLGRVARRYEQQLPLIVGAVQAVQRLAARWPLGLASSSARSLIALVLERAQLAPLFVATVSSDEVAHGKPAPDVYLEAARRLGVQPGQCVAVEDSSNGICAGVAAGMRVVAIPNAHYPPDIGALALASVVLNSLRHLSMQTIEHLH